MSDKELYLDKICVGGGTIVGRCVDFTEGPTVTIEDVHGKRHVLPASTVEVVDMPAEAVNKLMPKKRRKRSKKNAAQK